MDALMSSAQLWGPWAGVAALFSIRAWISALGLVGARQSTYWASAYFASLALAFAAPVVAALLAWSLYGGLALLGPIVMLLEPGAGQQSTMLFWVSAPAGAYLLLRFVCNTPDANRFVIALAALLSLWNVWDAPVVIAVALAIGGAAGFAADLLGDLPGALGSCALFILIFAFTTAGGAGAVPVLTLCVVGGVALALLAAGGKRERYPWFAVAPLVPALALVWLGHGRLGFETALAKPAIGNYGSLVLMFAVFPMIAAIFAWLGALLVLRVHDMRQAVGFRWAEPLVILIELVLGVVLAGIAALALAAGGALFAQLRELAGGAGAVQMGAMIRQIRPAPLGPGAWWALALVVLPIAPAAAHLFVYFTHWFLRLLQVSGLAGWLDRAIAENRYGERLVLRLTQRIVQLVPSAFLLAALGGTLLPIAWRHQSELSSLTDSLLDVCSRAAQAIRSWRI